MRLMFSWLERKKACLCILAGICTFSLFVIYNSDETIKESSGNSYVVKIKHYGLDAAEIERSITIPLEDALSAIPGIMSVQSSSENSLSRVFIRFKQGGKGKYESVRDAAQRVYENLSSSAQRPEILSSENSMIPVWSSAVLTAESNNAEKNTLAGHAPQMSYAPQMLEKIVKPRLECLEDAGEVLVSGTGVKEIVIVLDQEKLASMNIEPYLIMAALGFNDSIFSGGTIVHQQQEIIVTVDGRYSPPNTAGTFNAPALEKSLIPLGDGKVVELSEIAAITEHERMPDILSRLNGRKAAVISIMGRHGADLRKLSRDIKKELNSLSLPLEFIVLSDRGAEETAAFRSVFNAALLGAIMVAIIGFLTGSRKSFKISGFFCALTIPLICLVSVAVLSILGFSASRLLLAGIAAGVGTAVNSVILCSEKLRKCISYSEASAALSQLSGPLTAGAATTAAALFPLSLIEGGEAGIIASAITTVTLTAFVITLSFLPPLLLWGLKADKNKQVPQLFTRASASSFLSKFSLSRKFLHALYMRTHVRISRYLARFLAANVKFCLRYPILNLSIALALTVTAVTALYVKGADTASYGSEDSLYAQVEFDGGLLAEEADRLLSVYSENLAANKGIRNVETGARTGTGSILVSFDSKQTNSYDVRNLAKQILIPGGFLFFHENSAKDRHWEIKISGDEDKKCREIAQELAHLCAGHPLIRECVLNFKDGSKKLVLQPVREHFAETMVSFSAAANKLRLGVYGPVAYKRTDSKGEIDVRIRTGSENDLKNNVMRQSREGTLGVLVYSNGRKNSSGNSVLRIDSLMNSREETEPVSIGRTDRCRTASITVITEPKDPRRVKKELDAVFKKLNLPPGYSVEFDPDAIRQAQMLTATIISLLMAAAFCYMILASINESFTIPFFVLAAIPPSLAVPAICLALSGSAYNLSIACAFIAVSGMTVNAAVLCVDGLKSILKNRITPSPLIVYSALRRKMPALLATTAATAAGAIPFLFLGESANILIRMLSLVGALGVTSSLFSSIIIIPSLLFLFKNKRIVKMNLSCASR